MLSLYRQKRTGDLLILNYAVNPRIGASLAWGHLIRVSSTELRAEGPKILVKNLSEFAHRNVRDADMWFKESIIDEDDFLQSHDLIQVELTESKTLQLWPMKRAIGETGFTGDPEDVRNMSTDVTSEEFWAILESTFAVCDR